MENKDFITIRDLQEHYRVSRQCIYLWIKKEKLPEPRTMPSGKRYWLLSDLEGLLIGE